MRAVVNSNSRKLSLFTPTTGNLHIDFLHHHIHSLLVRRLCSNNKSINPPNLIFEASPSFTMFVGLREEASRTIAYQKGLLS